MKFIWATALLAVVGCASEDPELDSTESPIVSSTTPYTGPSVFFAAWFPVPVGRGQIAEATDYSNTSFLAAHSASYTDGVDLRAPALTNREDTSSTTGYRTRLQPTGWDFLQAPAFRTHLDEAWTQADTHMTEMSTGVLHTAGDLLSSFGFDPEYQGPNVSFAGWTPPRARWLESQWARAPGAPASDPETHYRYADPYALATFPQRGARLYCAAREVARHQGSEAGSLGEQVLLPIKILGQRLDIGVFEPSANVNLPEKFTSGPDGAQAFNIPFTMGIKITPIRHLLPAFPELRFPFVLTTADSEVLNNVGRESIYEEKRCVAGGFICLRIPRQDYRYRYKTVSHADTAMSAGASMMSNASFPVFWAGPLLVNLQIALGASIGQPIDGPAGPRNDRLLLITNPPPGLPTEYRKQGMTADYLDGAWLNQALDPVTPGDELYEILKTDDDGNNAHAGNMTLTPQNPMRARVHADDDHHVSPSSELRLSGGLEGIVGFNVSIARIQIVASGTVTGTVGLAHDVREGVTAYTALGPTMPVAGVTITPVTYGSANLEFKVNFHLHISLPIVDDIDVNYMIIDKALPFASFTHAWQGEDHRVRIGTDSTLGNPTQSPAVASHVGGPLSFPPFASFPLDGGRSSVDACLADESKVPAPPPPCKGDPADGTPPRTQTCAYVEVSNQIDPCLNIPPPSDFNEHQNCEHAKLTYLCNPVAKQQFFDGKWVLAHVLDLPDPAHREDMETYSPDLKTFAEMVQVCAKADFDAGLIPAGTDPSGVSWSSLWFKGLFNVASCDATAQLYKPSDIVTSSGKPDGETAGTCH